MINNLDAKHLLNLECYIKENLCITMSKIFKTFLIYSLIKLVNVLYAKSSFEQQCIYNSMVV